MARATSKTRTSAGKTGTGKSTARKSGTLTAAAKPAAGAAAVKPRAAAKPPGKLPEVKPAAKAPAAPEPVVVETAKPVVSAPELGKKELVEQAVERSGIKKRDAKPVVEAVLALLGEAVAEGRELNLKPFGKLRINRSQERSNGKVFVCKLRQPAAVAEPAQEAPQENAGEEAKSSPDPLAEAAADR
ncbi:MAG: HU family DNA-binding protein [Leisingera sp.]